jgi:hypothetical protein
MESSKDVAPDKTDKDVDIVYDLNFTVPFNPAKESKTDIEARCDAIVASIIKEIDKTFAKK